MADNRPVHEIRVGMVCAAIWKNHHGSHGPWFRVTVLRVYKDGELWKDSHSFYGEVPEGKVSPERVASRYTARMPEDRAPMFKAKFEQELQETESRLSDDVVRIALCDGARGLWTYIDGKRACRPESSGTLRTRFVCSNTSPSRRTFRRVSQLALIPSCI